VRPAETVQRDDQRRLFVAFDFRRNEERVRNVFVRVGEMMHANLHPRIDWNRSAPTAALDWWALRAWWCLRGWRCFLRGLLRAYDWRRVPREHNA
jgi:hypothetical protein